MLDALYLLLGFLGFVRAVRKHAPQNIAEPQTNINTAKARDNSAAGSTLFPGFLIFSSVLLNEVMAVEKRGLKYHRGRVGEALREAIETMVEGELADRRIGLVSVTAVHIADDGRSAQVWVNVEGDDADADQSLEGLEAARESNRNNLV